MLCRENGLTLCDWLRGTLSTRKTWKRLHYLINLAYSKTESHHMTRIIQHLGDVADLLDTLRARHLRAHQSPAYTGSLNLLPDEDIYPHEVVAAVSGLHSPDNRQQKT